MGKNLVRMMGACALAACALVAAVGCSQPLMGGNNGNEARVSETAAARAIVADDLSWQPTDEIQRVAGPFYDESGQIETRIYYVGTSGQHNTLSAIVDSSDVLIGGGAVTRSTGMGGLLTGSYPEKIGKSAYNAWTAQSKDHMEPDHHPIWAFAIGMRLIGDDGNYIPVETIQNLMYVTGRGGDARQPDVYAESVDSFNARGGYIQISGGAQVWVPFGNPAVDAGAHFDNPNGQLLTRSSSWSDVPEYNQWNAQSFMCKVLSDTNVNAYQINIARDIPGFGSLEVKKITSGMEQTFPYQGGTVAVEAAPGYVVSGVGGSTYAVNSPDGNLPLNRYLTGLGIKLDGSGVYVNDHDHLIPKGSFLFAECFAIKKQGNYRYAVTFDARGGSAVPAQSVMRGRPASEPVEPSRDGSSFAGWYSDEACTSRWDFSHPVSGALTLYAKWFAGTPFITVWQTDRQLHVSETSGANQIKLPLLSDGSYDFFVEWGDGNSCQITKYDDPAALHTYAFPGVYTVKIYGVFNGIRFCRNGPLNDGDKLIEIRNWGALRLGNGGLYFAYCDGLTVTAQDLPDFAGTTNFTNMFSECHMLTSVPRMNEWDVSRVINMGGMFYCAFRFNEDIGGWDVSSAQNMWGMFENADAFNQNLGRWNVSKVKYMDNMFGASSSPTPRSLSTVNYDALLNGWASRPVQPGVRLDAPFIQFSAASAAARAKLTGAPNNWLISDGGLR